MRRSWVTESSLPGKHLSEFSKWHCIATAAPQLRDTLGLHVGTARAESLGIREAGLVLEANSATSARVREKSQSAGSLELTPAQEADDLPREANLDT